MDERIRLMDEIISGVQVIKMYAWEKPFCAMVELARKLELRVVTKSSYIRGIYMTFNLFTTRMALYCTLITMLIRLSSDRRQDLRCLVLLQHSRAHHDRYACAQLRRIRRLYGSRSRFQAFIMFEEFRDSNVIVSKTSSSYANINSDFKRISKPDLPYVDDVKNQLESHEENENSDHRKHNGLIIANDLLRNANFIDGNEESKFK